ncbi:TrbG/VirB9 family P-type conjugative transfer protein [Francisella philomiragia]|uniref:TrbG/VirB9 family P-type conjugative transfer protein n=1 Tax=Francisella philomiragia TaxID=28110 RepID=UPI00190864B2|nr:TrbG/VirB9 family P-type conjugative transfer protein [Francisella philomiragia]MBK2341728.1 TrbG/VirB9 family P-type conjugative transfer protein [Francisella philomiragia]
MKKLNKLHKLSKLNKYVVLGLVAVGLSSCAGVKRDIGNFFGYSDENYIPKDQADEYFKKNYLAKGVKVPKVEYEIEKIPVSRSAVMTSFGFSQNPEIKKAYENYVSGGAETVVRSEGFVTYPYDPYQRPILECSLGRVCAVQLETGEKITPNGLIAGDTVRWDVAIQTTGAGDKESQVVSVQPRFIDSRDPKEMKQMVSQLKPFSTNLRISTNKRIYNIGLLGQPKGSISTVMNFYYPFETAQATNSQIAQLYRQHEDSVQAQNITFATDVKFDQINTKYSISEKDNPAWKPTQVFDDGHKTFIKLPENADTFQLPAVWVVRDNNKEELSSNASYKKPYYVLDGVYKKIIMFTGTDNNRTQVTITRD